MWRRRPGSGHRGPYLNRWGGLRPMAAKVFSQTAHVFQYFTTYITLDSINMFFHMMCEYVWMPKIPSIDWTETGRRRCLSGRRSCVTDKTGQQNEWRKRISQRKLTN